MVYKPDDIKRTQKHREYEQIVGEWLRDEFRLPMEPVASPGDRYRDEATNEDYMMDWVINLPKGGKLFVEIKTSEKPFLHKGISIVKTRLLKAVESDAMIVFVDRILDNPRMAIIDARRFLQIVMQQYNSIYTEKDENFDGKETYHISQGTYHVRGITIPCLVKKNNN